MPVRYAVGPAAPCCWRSQVVDALGDLGRYIVEFAFGDIYDRPGPSLRDRELVTVAMLAAMGGCEPQLDVHLKAASTSESKWMSCAS
ncbi:MAG: carboxymuconolactone decarboxylase family protein [Solirubrobacteraceae bacterium]